MIQSSTSPQQAFSAAEQLLGQWPHAKPPNPKTYSAAIAATLAAYPPGIVQECCDPRKGLARTREFPPTVAAIIEWCDLRLAHHIAVAAYQGNARPREVIEEQISPEQKSAFGGLLNGLLDKLRFRNAPIPRTPLDQLGTLGGVLRKTVSPSLEQIVREKGWAK